VYTFIVLLCFILRYVLSYVLFNWAIKHWLI